MKSKPAIQHWLFCLVLMFHWSGGHGLGQRAGTIDLTIISEPAECRLFINGTSHGTTGPEGRRTVTLRLGDYTIRLEREGYKPKTITVSLDRPRTVRLSLEPVEAVEPALSPLDVVRKNRAAMASIATYDHQGVKLKAGCGFFPSPTQMICARRLFDSATRAEVRLGDGKVYPVQGVVAEAEDIDLIKVGIQQGLAPWMSTTEKLPGVGEKVIVMHGCAELERSFVEGVVSLVINRPGLERIVRIRVPGFNGSSGTPVLNLRGEVIGVIAAPNPDEPQIDVVSVKKVEGIRRDPLLGLADRASGVTLDQHALARDSFAIAFTAYQAKDYAKALVYFQEAAKNNPFYPKVSFYLGDCHLSLSQYEEAAKAYEREVGVNPSFFEAHLNLGVSYDKLKRYDDAVKAYEQAMRLRPDEADVHLNLGAAYDRLGRYQDAIAAYREVIRLRPNDADAYLNLGTACVRQRRWPEAEEAYKQALTLKTEWPQAYYGLGTVYQQTDRAASAEDAYKQAIRLQPDLVEAHHALGGLYEEQKNWPQAAEAYKQVVTIAPRNAQAHYRLGLVYVRLDDRASVEKQCEILKTLDQDLVAKLCDRVGK
jgi:tetratricopeptide (TPR) repeat protein